MQFARAKPVREYWERLIQEAEKLGEATKGRPMDHDSGNERNGLDVEDAAMKAVEEHEKDEEMGERDLIASIRISKENPQLIQIGGCIDLQTPTA